MSEKADFAEIGMLHLQSIPTFLLAALTLYWYAYRHWRALSEGIDLPWLRACAAEEECCSHFSAHAGQPRAQHGGCAKSQRTCGTDRGSRD